MLKGMLSTIALEDKKLRFEILVVGDNEALPKLTPIQVALKSCHHSINKPSKELKFVDFLENRTEDLELSPTFSTYDHVTALSTQFLTLNPDCTCILYLLSSKLLAKFQHTFDLLSAPLLQLVNLSYVFIFRFLP